MFFVYFGSVSNYVNRISWLFVDKKESAIHCLSLVLIWLVIGSEAYLKAIHKKKVLFSVLSFSLCQIRKRVIERDQNLVILAVALALYIERHALMWNMIPHAIKLHILAYPNLVIPMHAITLYSLLVWTIFSYPYLCIINLYYLPSYFHTLSSLKPK